jgi:tRNA pseudouridine38-40 synthase|tara:strand:- start:8562 stop:9341 length:780 start_codon:yes stop_codon:yes gene_type:complete
MRNIKLTIQYDGSNYHGWQIQPNGISIQQVIEEAIFSITKKEPKLTTSGRTDAGVHALSQVANFKTTSMLDTDKLQKGLNSILPKDIVILDAQEVPLDFHARICAKKKLYRYDIYNSPFPDAFSFKFAKFIPYCLNASSMKIASQHFLGKHDFSAFRSSSCEAKTTVRTIYKIDLSQKFSNNTKNSINKLSFTPCWITIEVEGNGFLKNMVRNIVGTLIEVGREKLVPEDIIKILASRDRKNAGPTASPHGLFLVRVFY